MRPQITRSAVPILVGWLLSLLATAQIEIPSEAVEGFAQALVTVVYYVAVAVGEKYLSPRFGWLLGSARRPSYANEKTIPGDVVDRGRPPRHSSTRPTDPAPRGAWPRMQGQGLMGAWYTTREAVKGALDIAETARNDAKVDRAIAGATADIDQLCRRRGFAPLVRTRRFDWPSPLSPTPGRLWFEDDGLITLTSLTSGGVTIATSAAKLYPDDGPPYDRLDLDRTTSAAFGLGTGAQLDVSVAGVWGWDLASAAAGTLDGAISSTTATTIGVTDSAAVGVGDLLLVDSERMVVTGKTSRSTGQVLGAGGVAASMTADSAPVTTGSAYKVGEVLTIDTERMLVVDIVGNSVIVKRAWDGSRLAAHSAGATIFALRTLTVERAALGTTAATHLNGAAVFRHVFPSLVTQLATAQAVATLQAEGAGMAREAGSGERKQDVSGVGVDALRAAVESAHGRGKVRHLAV